MQFTVPHLITVTEVPAGREIDWAHPADCHLAEDQCEFARRLHRAADGYIAALVAGRPDGAYLLGLFGFHGLCLVGDDGRTLLPIEDAA